MKKPDLSTKAGRREYRRLYYQKHKDKFNRPPLPLKRKRTFTADNRKRFERIEDQGIKKTVINGSDFIHAPNTEAVLKKILAGKIGLTI